MLSSAIGEQATKIASTVWIHNPHSIDEGKMTIRTPEGHTITTSLKSSSVYDLICVFTYPVIRIAHGDKWKSATTARSDTQLSNDDMLIDYGITKQQILVSHIANAMGYAGYDDAKH